jgi:subtilase family serine protease
VGDRQKRLLQILVVAAVLAIPVVSVADAATGEVSNARVRVQAASVLPRHARTLGALPSSTPLNLTVALRPRNASALQSFATAVSTPGSPQYRHFLTVGQFADRFGATTDQIASVRSQLRAQGLTVGAPSANHLSLKVSGSAAQVQNAFATALSRVRLANGRSTYANTQAVALPASLRSAVQGVVGLDGADVPQPQYAKPSARRARGLRPADAVGAQAATSGPQPCQPAIDEQQAGAANGDAPRLAPGLAAGYNFTPYYLAGDLGQGQTVALFEEGAPYPTSDVGEFQGCYGTQSGAVTLVPVDGGPGPYNANDPNSVEGDGEVTLDIDVVNEMAPQASILVYSAPGTAAAAIDTLTAIVSQNLAKVVSISYGACEKNTPAATSNAQNTLLQEAAAQGQSVFASSGDAGDDMCSQQNNGQPTGSLSVIDPGNQPFITSVGGTELDSINTSTNSPNEGVWNSGPGSGSGGGVSQNFTMPSYQSSAASFLGLVNANSGKVSCGGGNCREVPDVAADAAAESGYVVYSNGKWTVTGGTSGSSPFWAGFFALANASSACRGLSLGFANPAMYQIAGTSYLSNFFDVSKAGVITGAANNDVFGDENGIYPVNADYDMTTGLGSPNAGALGNSLCSARAPVYTVSVASPGNQTATVGKAVSLAVHATDSGGQTLTYTATGLPAGLSMSAAGVITGTPTTPQTAIVAVSAADQFTNAGATSFTWTVSNPAPPPPPVKVIKVGKVSAQSAKVSGLGNRKPKLSFTLNAGANAPALKSVAITLPKGLSFAGKAKTVTKGVTLKSGAKKLPFTPAVKRGVLSLVFKAATPSASLTLAKPAITISKGEATAIRTHKVKTLVFKLKTTNASKQTASLTITLKKLS